MVQSFFFLGSVVWPKNALVKTFAAGISIMVVYTLFAITLGKAVLPDNFYMADSNFSDETARTLVTSFNFMLVLFNWVIAYFRFKESEIINRW